ncbi:MAG: hypothetical protein PF485_03740 [Bacteroidales bacterium]|jgi:uncharacterized membrane protein YoaK (UPF0700 family)|nr:hypothetical protein [Bacteroidales bacterium]
MDFKDIKNAWKDSFEDEELLNKEDIEAKLRIKSKSNTALNKVKRNYKIELIFGGILSLLFLLTMYFNLRSQYRLLLMFFTILFFGILLSFTWRNFRRIRKTVITNENLKSALIKTIKDIERYVNFNKSNIVKYLLMPFAICFGMTIGLFMGADEQNLSEIFTKHVIIKLSIVLVVLSIVFIPIAQYFNKKMYKQHLDELKQCLKDFEETEE